MRDILPEEMEIRERLLKIIKDTYLSFGFTLIETPSVEHIENLLSKQGGDNEKLIFKILKRGEKLKAARADADPDTLADCGLRYDLTLPLARYYAAHASELPSPFKALQTGNVWRADRPQKGRFREFTQCDIDIIGEPGILAESELILATSSALSKMGFTGFRVYINDRDILRAMARKSGFREEDFDAVFIILDKTDKIEDEEAVRQIAEIGPYDKDAVRAYLDMFGRMGSGPEALRYCRDELAGFCGTGAIDRLDGIIKRVTAAKDADYEVVFDPTLVRGQSYYTSTIFEIRLEDGGLSVAGGGRYDKMIERFTGQPTPACGFSIGFERIVMRILEGKGLPASNSVKKAYLLEKGLTDAEVADALRRAAIEREAGRRVLVVNMKKNKKFQKEQLAARGYDDIEEIFSSK